MDRARLRERLASGPIRLAMSMSSSDEEGSGTRPTVPSASRPFRYYLLRLTFFFNSVPLPEVINTSPPRASGNTDWPRPGPGHGSSRMDAQSQGIQKRVLMRLADVRRVLPSLYQSTHSVADGFHAQDPQAARVPRCQTNSQQTRVGQGE